MFKIRRLITLIFFFFTFSVLYSQDKTIDSLKIILRNPKVHDTTKLTILGSVMDSKYTENDPKYYYLNQLMGTIALKNLKKHNNSVLHETYTLWLGTYYNVLAIDYGHKKEAVKGLAAIDKSIGLYKSIKAYDDVNYQIIIKGSFYSLINENEKAIACLFTALKYFEKDKKKNSGEIAYAMSILGNIYATLGNYRKSIEYNKKVIEYHSFDNTHIDYQKDQLKSVAYANIANGYLSLNEYAEAVAYSEKALGLSKKTGDKTNTSLILSKLALAKMAQLQYNEAEVLLKEALPLSTNERALAQVNLTLGKLYHGKKEYAKAEFYANEALLTGKKTKDLELQEKTYSLLYWIQEDAKDFEKALQTFKLYNQISDSVKTNASKNILAQQQLKYDFEKKELNYKLTSEQENAAKNNWLISLSAALLLIVLGGYFYYRNNKQKQAISVLEKNQIKQKLLISQMNPHFIFNSIQNIRGLINNKQDTAAVNYLDRFSKLTRQILENSNENYISLEEEVEMIENYLSIQQLLYNNKFKFSITVADAIETDSVFLPPMLTQPFIENAIKHGLSNTNENGRIDISFYLKDAQLFFEVSDNGKGFGTDKKSGNHKSLAMKITQERLNHYTKNQNFIVQTNNITDNDGNVKGAKVHFEIPYIYEN
jgi:tetratricopeptide (TPR) repeat protein